MTSSQDYASHHRTSSDVNNKASFATVNNNPSASPLVADYVLTSSPMMRSVSMATDPPAAVVTNRRSDVLDYRGGSGPTSVVAAGISPSFRSPKLEPRGASGSSSSARKAQKTLHHSSMASSSGTGKWRQRTTDISAGGRSQASDSVRKCLSWCLLATLIMRFCSKYALLKRTSLGWHF